MFGEFPDSTLTINTITKTIEYSIWKNVKMTFVWIFLRNLIKCQNHMFNDGLGNYVKDVGYYWTCTTDGRIK